MILVNGKFAIIAKITFSGAVIVSFLLFLFLLCLVLFFI